MKSFSNFLILYFIFLSNIINCRTKAKKRGRNRHNPQTKIPLADSIRPDDISRELFCDACHAFFIEALKNLRNLNKESDITFYLNDHNICSYKNFNGYHFSNLEIEVACEVIIGEYYDAVEKLLIERIPNKDTDASLINKFCYEKIKACNGVDLSKFKPVDAEVINGQIYEKETEEQVVQAFPVFEDVDIDDDDLNDENRTNFNKSAEL